MEKDCASPRASVADLRCLCVHARVCIWGKAGKTDRHTYLNQVSGSSSRTRWRNARAVRPGLSWPSSCGGTTVTCMKDSNVSINEAW
jgi:hypothetical protein